MIELLFWLSLACVGWCYLGYPIVMRLRAWKWPLPLQPEMGGMGAPMVSIVLPVRNGERQLSGRIENLRQLDYPAERIEILVVCNGCTDGSEAIAAGLAQEDGRVRVLVSDPGQGKAGALNMGAAHARGEFLLMADVRQTFAPDAASRLLEPFRDPSVGGVSGRLDVARSDRAVVEGMRIYWGREVQLRDAESRTGSVVGVTGAIYALRRECFEPIPPNTILDDVWLPMRIAMRGYRVLLARDAVAYDLPATDSRHEYLRKRRTTVGNLQLVRQMPELLNPRRNPLFFRYLSHKLLRLASPLCFLTLLLTAALLSGGFYRAAFAGELLLYAVGALGLRFRIAVPGVPMASAFVMMHVVTFAALRRFREDAAAVWVSSSQGVLAREAVE